MQQQAKTQRLSLQEIWRLGCADQPLHPLDAAHYTNLARSRFHTYMLGMQHAERKSPDAALLVKGMTSELSANPGLEKEWRRYNFADSSSGKQVTETLDINQTTVRHSTSLRSKLRSLFSKDKVR